MTALATCCSRSAKKRERVAESSPTVRRSLEWAASRARPEASGLDPITGGGSGGPTQIAEGHFYDAENHLRLFNRHVGIGAQSPSGSNWMYEEYRYDALGRRIWRRAQGEPQSYVSRTVWDGDQYLYETISSSNTGYGLESDSAVVGYIHATGLDAPVGVWRGTGSGNVGTITPHEDWRGAYAFGTWEDGTPNPCNGGSPPKCSYIAWPASGMSVARGHPLDATLGSGYWMGALLSEATDGSGMQYKRNRYYDPSSGRFTQVDPAGLGGGLNAYGFGGGDQVNYGDPFGLCTDPNDQLCRAFVDGMEGLGATAGFLLGSSTGTVETVASAGLAAPIAVAQTAAATVSGAMLGKAVGEKLASALFSGTSDGQNASTAGESSREPTAGDIIAKSKKGGINRVFPEEMRSRTLAEIRALAQKGNRTAQTAKKLLTDKRFNK